MWTGKGVPVKRTPPSNLIQPLLFAFKSGSVIHRYEISFARSFEHLSRPSDTLLGVVKKLFPLSEPSDGPGNREENWKHLHRKTHRLINEAGVEVYVWIQIALDEEVFVKCDPFEFQRDIQERVSPGNLEHLVSRSLDDTCECKGDRRIRLVSRRSAARTRRHSR